MLHIYKKVENKRSDHAISVIFDHVLKTDYKLISDKEELKSVGLPIINYSEDTLQGALQIIPYHDIWNTDKKIPDPEVFIWKDLPVFFKTGEKEQFLPFDIFALTFFLVTRYEEYFAEDQDVHNRFKYENSHAFKNAYLDLPLVNLLACKFLEAVVGHCKIKLLSASSYSFLPTVDVDIAFAHKGKSWLRSAASFLKLLVKQDLVTLHKRMQVQVRGVDDPYDNFYFILEVFKKHNIKPVFFILAGNYGRYDKNISYRNKEFRQLIRFLSEQAEIGLHPSYSSYRKIRKIRDEKSRLEDITGKEITKSRQHFLRFHLPDTYYQLMDAGIKEDYSMGYSNCTGFRAGISSPYPFFDLRKNEEMEIMIYPFAFMDTAISKQMKYPPEKYTDHVKVMIADVKKGKGVLSSVWHNYDLADNAIKHVSFAETINECVK